MKNFVALFVLAAACGGQQQPENLKWYCSSDDDCDAGNVCTKAGNCRAEEWIASEASLIGQNSVDIFIRASSPPKDYINIVKSDANEMAYYGETVDNTLKSDQWVLNIRDLKPSTDYVFYIKATWADGQIKEAYTRFTTDSAPTLQNVSFVKTEFTFPYPDKPRALRAFCQLSAPARVFAFWKPNVNTGNWLELTFTQQKVTETAFKTEFSEIFDGVMLSKVYYKFEARDDYDRVLDTFETIVWMPQ